MQSHKIILRNVNKTFSSKDGELKVLEDINVYLDKEEFVSIIGPSGCGKSTIFQLITGIAQDYNGEIIIDDVSLENYNKRISYMHQKDLLMPWMDLIKNLSLPLEIQGSKKSEAKERVLKLLPEFGLEGFENSYPKELSGGMKQRAALLRTLLIESDIMLLDEPFGALDAINRTKMQEWLLHIWNKYKRSVFFITHDIEEAIYLSDRIYILSDRPATILKELTIDFERPRNKEIILSPKFAQYKKILIESLT